MSRKGGNYNRAMNKISNIPYTCMLIQNTFHFMRAYQRMRTISFVFVSRKSKYQEEGTALKKSPESMILFLTNLNIKIKIFLTILQMSSYTVNV